MVTKHPNLLERMSVGRPTKYPTVIAWLLAGIRRQSWFNLLVATIVGWSGIWVVLWIAALAAIFGAIGGVVGANNYAPGVTQSVLGQSSIVFAMVLGGAAGLVGGFVGSLLYIVLASPVSFVVTIVGGAILSFFIVCYLVCAESWILRLHGYRRLSRREQARIEPLVTTVAKRMGLTSTPQILIADGGCRNAYAYLRHIVIGKLLFDELTDEALAGILAHELHHCNEGDTVGLRFIYACALPVILLYDLGALLTQTRHSALILIGWAFLWPAWVIMHVVIEPLLASRSRNTIEYECDAKAKEIGYGEGLTQALSYFGDFENGSTGWMKALIATHPPLELRLEQLEEEDSSIQRAS